MTVNEAVMLLAMNTWWLWWLQCMTTRWLWPLKRNSLTLFIFCFELAVVFLLPSLLGLLDELDDIKFSDPDWPFILGKDTELFRELRKRTVKYFCKVYLSPRFFSGFLVVDSVLCDFLILEQYMMIKRKKIKKIMICRQIMHCTTLTRTLVLEAMPWMNQLKRKSKKLMYVFGL